MTTATDTPAGRVRHFMSLNPRSPIAARLTSPFETIEVTVADLSAVVSGSATKAQESNVRVFCEEYERRMEIDHDGVKLLKEDVRTLLDFLDPERLDPADVVDVTLDWPEGSEGFRLTRRQLGELLVQAEALAAEND
ncbi:hypothetical protein [Kitasatospora sp. NPDC002965]|uniref:hypothetical protein n=1 Tax=Kitasatospora sp. NPDC002965 TaxID=3154775 RepID=UPI0033A2305D